MSSAAVTPLAAAIVVVIMSRATTRRILAVSLLPSNNLSLALELFPVFPVLLFPFFLSLYFLGSLCNSNLRTFFL
jgi:hypothetical protein